MIPISPWPNTAGSRPRLTGAACVMSMPGSPTPTRPTGLIPRNLRESRDFWNGRDSGADNYAFDGLTAAMTDRPRLLPRMIEILRTERGVRLTARHDHLCDDYSFSTRLAPRSLRSRCHDLRQRRIREDGLLPITEWSARVRGRIGRGRSSMTFGRTPRFRRLLVLSRPSYSESTATSCSPARASSGSPANPDTSSGPNDSAIHLRPPTTPPAISSNSACATMAAKSSAA